jgi:DNA-binding transcriptional MerR regulator
MQAKRLHFVPWPGQAGAGCMTGFFSDPMQYFGVGFAGMEYSDGGISSDEGMVGTQDIYRTSEVARAAGVHPNTVRVYEQWGFLPPVKRSPNGYRRYSRFHLEQMKLARLALHGGWPGGRIRRSALALVRSSAAGDLREAVRLAGDHVRLVKAERAQAESAAAYLEKWVRGRIPERRAASIPILAAAKEIDSTVDAVRNWERNGLLRVPRNPKNGYREYGPREIGRLRVIRMLLRAGYSTMAVLRAMRHLDSGGGKKLRRVLDTPRPEEDVLWAADRWLSTLSEHEDRACRILNQLRRMDRIFRGRKARPPKRIRARRPAI